MTESSAKLQVRLDRRLKEAAEEVFAEIGLDAATAVRIFFAKVARTRSIPFRLGEEPETFSPEEVERILEADCEADDPASCSRVFDSVEEMFQELRQPFKPGN